MSFINIATPEQSNVIPNDMLPQQVTPSLFFTPAPSIFETNYNDQQHLYMLDDEVTDVTSRIAASEQAIDYIRNQIEEHRQNMMTHVQRVPELVQLHNNLLQKIEEAAEYIKNEECLFEILADSRSYLALTKSELDTSVYAVAQTNELIASMELMIQHYEQTTLPSLHQHKNDLEDQIISRMIEADDDDFENSEFAEAIVQMALC